jgi:hypothetical protein
MYITQVEFTENDSQSAFNQITKALEIYKTIYLNSNLPPCFPMVSDKILFTKGNIVHLHKNSTIVLHNLYYGEQYQSLNKILLSTQDTVKNCHSCSHYQCFMCRGIPSNKFWRGKAEIISRISLDNYLAVKSDFENSVFTCGSACNLVCSFCLDNHLPENVFRKPPWLTPSEIQHFSRYLPRELWFIGSSYHCKSGEITFSPFFLEITKILTVLTTKNGMFITNGTNLTEPNFVALAKTNLEIGISLISMDNNWRSKYLTGAKGDVYIDFATKILQLKKIIKNRHVSFVPLKSLIANNDIVNSIQSILAIDSECKIRIMPPSYHQGMDPEIISELSISPVEYLVFKNRLKKLFREKVYFVDESVVLSLNIANQIVSNVKRYMLVSRIENKTLALIPESSFQLMNGLFQNANVKTALVKSALYNTACSGVLFLADYCRVIDALDDQDVSIFILPRNTFDINFQDITLSNLNDLSNKYPDKQFILL